MSINRSLLYGKVIMLVFAKRFSAAWELFYTHSYVYVYMLSGYVYIDI